ncbi:MAG TPA: hypothetical protein PK741_10265, partial [Petrotogaceae bacterium]|nr:hypothetical protein [Petrotogaceae bacterium]
MKKKILSLVLMLSMLVSLTLLTAGCSAPASTAKVDVPKAAEALWNAGSTRDKIVVISDLHLGIDDRYTETINNIPFLIDFLKRLQSTKDVRELVIAGDF